MFPAECKNTADLCINFSADLKQLLRTADAWLINPIMESIFMVLMIIFILFYDM